MFYVIEHRVARQLNMTPVAVMGSRKLPPVVSFDNNNEENDFGNMFKGILSDHQLLKSIFLWSLDANPSVLDAAEAENAAETAPPKPSDPVIEDNSSQITTTTTDTNLDPEDITDQLDELIQSSPKRVKMD